MAMDPPRHAPQDALSSRARSRRTGACRVLAVSMSEVEADIADGLTRVLQMAGWPRANRSLVIREALRRLHEDLADKTPDEIVQYFLDRQSRRLRAAPSDPSPGERRNKPSETT